MMQPILITGCPRSFTSLVAGTIHQSGAWGGEMRPANSNNKKGMFENIEIVNNLVKPYLKSLGVDPMGQKPLVDPRDLETFDKMMTDGEEFWRIKVADAIDRQGWDYNNSWFYKDPKTCHLWPLWHAAFPEAKWVIVRRNDKDVISSFARTSFMRAYRSEAAWQKWIDIHKLRFLEMRDHGLNIIEVWPEKSIAGDFREMGNIINWLGLEWNRKEFEKFMDPALTNGGR